MNSTLKRSISGAIFAAVMVLAVFCKAIFPFCMLFIIGGMLHEFFKISLGGRYPRERIAAVLTGLLFFSLVYSVCAFGMPRHLVTVILIPVLGILISFLFEKDRSGLEGIAFLYMGLLYIALPAGLIPVLEYRTGEFDGRLLMSFFILIWMSDVGAYCIGTLLGQKPGSKKLAPSISPKKSWWGVAGCIFFSIVASVVLKLVGWLDISICHAVAFAVIIGASCVIGDLVESVWKRHFGIKDSGNVIPGHGGLLDRFDSSLFAITLGSVYLAIFNLL